MGNSTTARYARPLHAPPSRTRARSGAGHATARTARRVALALGRGRHAGRANEGDVIDALLSDDETTGTSSRTSA